MVDVKKERGLRKTSSEKFEEAILNALNMDSFDYEDDGDMRDHAVKIINDLQSSPKSKDQYDAEDFRKAVLAQLGLDQSGYATPLIMKEHVLGLIQSLLDTEQKYLKLPKGKTDPTVTVFHLERPALSQPTAEICEQVFGYMLDRLIQFERKNPGLELGWMQPDWPKQCSDAIRRCLEENQYIDAMNYIMFAFAHGWPLDEALVAPEAVAPSAARSWQYEFRNVKDSNDYSELVKVLHDALTQAAYGKGRERHANDLPFSQQPMNAISDLINSPLGLVYQVCKKVVEGVNLPTHDQRVRELLGVINYTAGIVIWLNRHQSNPPKE
ncbi:hypothetical protein AAF897_004080 [Salmonella enterica subsp. enterica serovar Anatum]|nr:hypothetical protein [Salmonella enterica subsp. enterica serovar Chester]